MNVSPQLTDDGRMPFMEHLRELRTRLIRGIIAVGTSCMVCFFFAEPVYSWLVRPLIDTLPENQKFIGFLSPVEPFLVYLKTALLMGVFVSSPVLLYQIWAFVAPGLYEREKRAVLPFVLFGTVFFIGGALFCRYVVLPLALDTLVGVAINTKEFAIQPQITMNAYFGVVTRLLLAFGVIFEMPVVVLFLSWARIIDHNTLIHYWRFAVVGAFIIGALLTPPDIATQMLLAGPMLVLYLLSIGIAYVFGGRGGDLDDDDDDDAPLPA